MLCNTWSTGIMLEEDCTGWRECILFPGAPVPSTTAGLEGSRHGMVHIALHVIQDWASGAGHQLDQSYLAVEIKPE